MRKVLVKMMEVVGKKMKFSRLVLAVDSEDVPSMMVVEIPTESLILAVDL